MRALMIKKLRESSRALKKLEHNHIESSYKADKLSFEPNPNMGEGEASQDELDYRAALISLLLPFYNKINTILGLSDSDKQSEMITKELSKFTDKAQSLVKNTVQDRYNEGIGSLNKVLEKNNQEPVKIKESGRRDALIKQQTDNIIIIASDLENKIRQKINMDQVKEYYPDELSEEERRELDQEEIDNIFLGTVNRTDATGFFGYNEPFQSGSLEAGIIAAAGLSKLELIVYVDTVGDENVCEECIERSDNGPYLPDEVPEDPHFGCRCTLRYDLRLKD